MTAFLQVSGDTVLVAEDPATAAFGAAAGLVAGATTISLGETKTRFCHIDNELQVAGMPVRAHDVGECWRIDDEVLSALPFQWEFEELSWVGPNPINRPFISMFWPDSARRLRFEFEMRVSSEGQNGVVVVTASNLLRPGLSQTFTTTSVDWVKKCVEFDLTDLGHTLDYIEGVFSGSLYTDTGKPWPNHLIAAVALTDIRFNINNLNGGTIFIRKTRDSVSRFLPGEIRDPLNDIVQIRKEDIDSANNVRFQQAPPRGYTQIDAVNAGIVAGQPVSPQLLTDLVQNDRSQAALLDIGPFDLTAPDANWTSGPWVDVYIPRWAGRIYGFAVLVALTSSGVVNPAEEVKIRINLNDGVEDTFSEEKVINSGGTALAHITFHWNFGDAEVWVQIPEAVVKPLRGTTVQLRYQMQNTAGTRTKTLYVDGRKLHFDFRSSMMPTNLVILPPQTNE